MGAYTLLQDLTVATNSTSVVLNDFGTITKDDFVKIQITYVKSGSGGELRFYLNNESTQSNYHNQRLVAFGSSVSASRSNIATFNDTPNGNTGFYTAYLKISENDRANVFTNNFHTIGTAVRVDFNYTTSSGATFPSGINSLSLVPTVTNDIGAGSRIQIYKLAATKVADITVASNTTQVDISSLSIDKDSEYLLVSDITYSGSASGLLVFVNDNTTANTYHSQLLDAFGSSAVADRINSPFVAYNGTGTRDLSYAHIKLSNIGAYTLQSYQVRNYGTSNVSILNAFVSSTAENITSITKINIKHSTTNAIGAGSRFILYKLYE